MPRPKTRPDSEILEAALLHMQRVGAERLTFSALAVTTGLSPSTLVQRFGSKDAMARAALSHAWDRLDDDTARLAASVERTPSGSVDLLVRLSGSYGDITIYADGLMLLREDIRDPVLRQRGVRWGQALVDAVSTCFAQTPGAPASIGRMMITQWQGALLWWSFQPDEPVPVYVEKELSSFVEALALPV
ncbi:TetR/AcrR family transcriptional regulator [Rhizobium sp. RCAM05350]|nr:TetR/AcrR family transcriptional regulator [Rhizobium sp. RCAM05350]